MLSTGNGADVFVNRAFLLTLDLLFGSTRCGYAPFCGKMNKYVFAGAALPTIDWNQALPGCGNELKV